MTTACSPMAPTSAGSRSMRWWRFGRRTMPIACRIPSPSRPRASAIPPATKRTRQSFVDTSPSVLRDGIAVLEEVIKRPPRGGEVIKPSPPRNLA